MEPALPVVRNWPLALCASMLKHTLAAFRAAPACVCSDFCLRYAGASRCICQGLQSERVSSAVDLNVAFLLLYIAWPGWMGL